MPSITLFEGVILLVISGAGGIAWWGIRRLVKMNDDGTKLLNKINESLALICERLSKVEMWMDMHEKSDDERHKELKESYKSLSKILIDRNIS